ncbi:putative zinc finger protein [Nocardioides albertanoniae]|uniref:Putative zinc finger protein n=1 Tax=Nocardioides albertanoniae TaxID=1175486 RepID=A0A543A7R1_9ACTN|nr:zf-HC2 domain-containing protein [Nocardioides albertanoniae]TQL68550.1 putative zinc finger protein [Nocardioides albertanoniae]
MSGMNDDLDATAHETFADWDASYVLGALSPSDRRAYERHLSSCGICRDATAELAGMPGLLGVLSREEAHELVEDDRTAVPASSLASLAGVVRRSRRNRRALATAAAVVLLAGGTALGGTLLDRDGAREPAAGPSASTPVSPNGPAGANARTLDLQPVGSVDLWAQLVVTPTSWGTSLRWSCHYPPKPGQSAPPQTDSPPEPVTYDLVLVDRDGGRTIAGSWTWSGGETLGLDASSAVPINDVERIEITLDGEETAIAAASLT